jgi:hypothetical protein
MFADALTIESVERQMADEERLRNGAELYRTAAERSRTRADRDHLLDCAEGLARIADWIAANRAPRPSGAGARGRDDQLQLREVYASENGDRWLLARHAASGRVFVRHEANIPSGGHVTDTELAEFLSGPPGSPERVALVDLISDLVGRN